MGNLENYDKIKYYFEDRFDYINEKNYRKIINNLTKINKEWETLEKELIGDNEEKFNTIHIKALDLEKDIDILYKLMETYHYNFAHTLLWIIADICNTTFKKTEEYLIERSLKSKQIYQITKENDTFVIDCSLGHIKFQKAPEYFSKLGKTNLVKLAENRKLADYCHDSTYIVTKNLENSFATTALCSQSFIGKFYHSFTNHNNNCIDLNHNCVIPYPIYQKMLQLDSIQEISHKDLITETQSFSQYKTKLLYKALNTQMQNKNLQKKLNIKIS